MLGPASSSGLGKFNDTEGFGYSPNHWPFSAFLGGFCGNQHLLGEDMEANCAPLLLAGRDWGAWPERQQGRQRGAGECAGHRQQLLFGGTCGGVVWLAGNRKRYRFNFFLALLPLLLCFIKYPHVVKKKKRVSA